MTSCPLRWKGIPSHFWDLLVQVIGTRGEIMSDRLNFRLPRPKMLKVDRWHANLWPPPPKTTSTFFLPYSILNSFYLFFLSKQQQKMYCTSQIFCFKIVFPFSFVHALVSLQNFCADSVICLGNRHRQNDKFV